MSIIAEATRVGFQWKDWVGPLRKVKEELRELEYEIRDTPQKRKLMSNELGDLLFSVCNLASRLGIDPETALQSTLGRFQSRFRAVEKGLKARGKTPQTSDLREMAALWKKAKV